MQVGPERIGRAGTAILLLALACAVALSANGYSAQLGIGGSLTGGSLKPAGVGALRGGVHPRAPRPAVSQAVGPLLTTMSYAKSAYLVYPGPVSAQAKLALAGFTFQVTRRTAGAMTVVLHGPRSGPRLDRTYPSTDKVYVVELATGDDANGSDYNSSDDGFVVTDGAGHVVR